MVLAEIPYPQIDPVIFRVGGFALRWYGVSYVLAFALAYVVLRWLAKRGRWPVTPERVGDVLFWGILGVFIGGRFGYMAFYAEDKSLSHWYRVWEGGMAFHGGLMGVILAYFIYAKVTKIRFRDLADGLALATPLGIVCVRIANFINAELIGRPFDGPWAMRFPVYDLSTMEETGRTVPSHPSQLYQGFTEGLLLFFLLRWLMIGKGWGGGRVASMFLIGYGGMRFFTEFFREPDAHVGYFFGFLTEGQLFSIATAIVGVVALALLSRAPAARPPPPPVALPSAP